MPALSPALGSRAFGTGSGQVGAPDRAQSFETSGPSFHRCVGTSCFFLHALNLMQIRSMSLSTGVVGKLVDGLRQSPCQGGCGQMTPPAAVESLLGDHRRFVLQVLSIVASDPSNSESHCLVQLSDGVDSTLATIEDVDLLRLIHDDIVQSGQVLSCGFSPSASPTTGGLAITAIDVVSRERLPMIGNPLSGGKKPLLIGSEARASGRTTAPCAAADAAADPATAIRSQVGAFSVESKLTAGSPVLTLPGVLFVQPLNLQRLQAEMEQNDAEVARLEARNSELGRVVLHLEEFSRIKSLADQMSIPRVVYGLSDLFFKMKQQQQPSVPSQLREEAHSQLPRRSLPRWGEDDEPASVSPRVRVRDQSLSSSWPLTPTGVAREPEASRSRPADPSAASFFPAFMATPSKRTSVSLTMTSTPKTRLSSSTAAMTTVARFPSALTAGHPLPSPAVASSSGSVGLSELFVPSASLLPLQTTEWKQLLGEVAEWALRFLLRALPNVAQIKVSLRTAGAAVPTSAKFRASKRWYGGRFDGSSVGRDGSVEEFVDEIRHYVLPVVAAALSSSFASAFADAGAGAGAGAGIDTIETGSIIHTERPPSHSTSSEPGILLPQPYVQGLEEIGRLLDGLLSV